MRPAARRRATTTRAAEPGEPAPTGSFRSLGPARWGLFSLALASFIAVTTELVPVGLLPAIGAGLDVGESTTGLLVSLYALMVAVLAVPVTLATRRVPRKPLIVATLAGYALSNLLVALAPGFALVAAGRALGGLTHALFFSIAIGYAARLVPPAHTARALALASAGASAGYVLGVPAATAVGTAGGWRAAFWMLVALALAALVLVVVRLPGVDARDPQPPVGASRPRRRGLVAVVVANLLVFLGHFTLNTYVSVVLLRSGAGPAAVGPILLLFGAVGLGVLLVAGRRFDRHPRGSVLAVVAAVSVGIVATGAGYPLLGAVVAAGVVWNGGFGSVSPLMQAAAVRTRVTGPEFAGAWINATSNIGIAAGAALGGVVLDAAGVPAVAWTGAALVAAAVAVILVARRAFPVR